jgi:hypothetical protein
MSTKDEAMTVSPNGQQTDCYTALELLGQMSNEEQKAAANGKSIPEITKHDNRWRYINIVMKLIKERQANAV